MDKPQIMLYISKLLRKGKQFMSNWKSIPPQILKKKSITEAEWKPGSHKMVDYKCENLSSHVY